MKKGSSLFSEAETDEICREYAKGLSCRDIGKAHYCSDKTIANCLKKNGIQRRGNCKFKYNRAMILNDWNAYIPVASMVKKYKIGPNCLYALISQMRRDGEKLLYRTRMDKEDKARYDKINNRQGSVVNG